MWPPPIVTPFDDFLTAYGSPATLYAQDATTVVTSGFSVALSNARYIPMLGTARGDLLMVQFPSTVPIVAGQVLAVPSQAAGWYVIVKPEARSMDPNVNIGMQCSVLALPYLVPVQATTAPAVGTLDAYDAPATVDAGGHPIVSTKTTTTVRMGFNADFNPLGNDPEGQMPRELRTGFVPLGSAVKKGDMLTLPDGTLMLVDQKNTEFADAGAFAYRLSLVATPGTGL